MEKLIGVVTLALMLVFAGAQIDRNADAITIITDHNIALNGANAVSYTFFSVTEGGVFNISADGRPAFTLLDPEIYLFIDNNSPSGALTGDFRATNDNSGGYVGPCSAVDFNPCNSLIANFSLAPNNYVVAVGAHILSLDSARSDDNTTGLSAGTVRLTIASADGFANLLQIPEPASFMLVGLGLLALRFALRRSRD